MSNIELIKNNNVVRLQLNRADVFNALSPDLLQELIGHCDELNKDESTKVVVLEGAGKHFCAGADLPQFTKNMASDPEGTADLGRRAANVTKATAAGEACSSTARPRSFRTR